MSYNIDAELRACLRDLEATVALMSDDDPHVAPLQQVARCLEIPAAIEAALRKHGCYRPGLAAILTSSHVTTHATAVLTCIEQGADE